VYAPQTVSENEWAQAIAEIRAEEKRATFHGPDGDRILRTYVTDGRGVEALGSVRSLLDLTPLGRRENWEDAPEGVEQDEPFVWWRRHDEYEGTAVR
jgi:predicted dithiol-disulfide oxidoreductase (DUF899 family)